MADCRRRHVFRRVLQLQAGNYEAWAAIAHHGNRIDMGHFTTFARNESRRWWSLDDGHVVTRDLGDHTNPYRVVFNRAFPMPSQVVDTTVVSWNFSGLNYSPLMMEGALQTIIEAMPTIIFMQEVTPSQVDALHHRPHSLHVVDVVDTQAQHTCIIAVRCPVVLGDVRRIRCSNTVD